jgi:glycosyltransferase involved in cell wall biosynthesis
MVAEAGLTDRNHFLGYRDDVPEIMAALHVKLFASEREGLPQVLVQADAVGVPIIAFEAEGVREMVRDGVNGFVFEYGDIAAMSQALERFIADPQLARRMGRQGRSLVDDRWEVITMQRQTQKLYDELLKEKGLL